MTVDLSSIREPVKLVSFEHHHKHREKRTMTVLSMRSCASLWQRRDYMWSREADVVTNRNWAFGAMVPTASNIG